MEKKKKKSMVTEKAHKLLSQSGEGPHPNPVKTRAGFQELRAQHWEFWKPPLTPNPPALKPCTSEVLWEGRHSRDGFSSSHIWMWELDTKESWALKYWCFWTVVLEKTLESSLDCKEIQPVHPKGNQSWIFIGRTDAEAETPILWLPDAKNWLIWKDPDVGKDWRQEEKGT